MYKNPYIKIKPVSSRPYMEVFLIRHCNPNYALEKKIGERNMPLSKLGLKQRKSLTKRLLNMKINKVYTSTLKRAQDTAADYLTLSHKKAIEDKRLDEINWHDWHRIKYFNMSEKTREKKLKNYLKLDKQLDLAQTKTRRVLADLFHDNYGKKVAIFSHGNFIKSILTGILNADIIGFLSLDIFQASISKLTIDRDGYVKISYINDINHLSRVPNKDPFITLID